MQSLPFSLAFVSSGSRGTRLLFYTRGRKRAEGNYGGLGLVIENMYQDIASCYLALARAMQSNNTHVIMVI